MATLSGRLPKGEHNGLGPITRALIDHPDEVHACIVFVDTTKLTTDVDTGEVEPTIRIKRIEAITDKTDGERLRSMLIREYERRTGVAALPIAAGNDMFEAFEA